MKQLIHHFQAAVTKHKTIWDGIRLVMALDLLQDNFEMNTATLLHSCHENLKKIQPIMTSTKAANLAKQATVRTADLAMMANKKKPQ